MQPQIFLDLSSLLVEVAPRDLLNFLYYISCHKKCQHFFRKIFEIFKVFYSRPYKIVNLHAIFVGRALKTV